MSRVVSSIQAGDSFEFVGIGDAPQGTDREILILGCTVTGQLSFTLKISFVDPTSNERETDVRPFVIQYADAIAMLNDGVWREA